MTEPERSALGKLIAARPRKTYEFEVQGYFALGTEVQKIAIRVPTKREQDSALAQAHADAVLLCGRLDAVADSARVAARTMRVIRQNLAWASVYNALAIPAAALGWLNPWLSGVGMALSSAVVVANALRQPHSSSHGVPTVAATNDKP